jgi:hypothetical protein
LHSNNAQFKVLTFASFLWLLSELAHDFTQRAAVFLEIAAG